MVIKKDHIDDVLSFHFPMFNQCVQSFVVEDDGTCFFGDLRTVGNFLRGFREWVQRLFQVVVANIFESNFGWVFLARVEIDNHGCVRGLNWCLLYFVDLFKI